VARTYRCLTTSVEGFVQQLACSYLRHGYWWYVSGVIPDWKSPTTVDQKLLDKYEVALSESTRQRRKKLGLANLQYLRFDRQFILLATAGRHAFYQSEAGAIRDIRRAPFKFHGYSISYRPGGRTRAGEKDPRWHAHVAIEKERYKEIRAHFLHVAVHRSPQTVALAFYRLPFEPYAPIRRQFLNLLRAVNRARKAAGFELLPTQVLPLRRRVVRPFEILEVPEGVPAITVYPMTFTAPPAPRLLRDETVLDGLSVRSRRPGTPLHIIPDIRSSILL
jgi:hypothetical protein